MNNAELLPNKKPIKQTRIPQCRQHMHEICLLYAHSQYCIPFLCQVLQYSTVYLLKIISNKFYKIFP